ncbi:hypothetical protein L3Y34_014039 [Caenorhabditis briggsae]|uniref:Uncharacterized protein n=2 Tax=Caenorhabditis briggsae TaxID=6238 RepID=A0AAE9DPS6_CAEBR|nr:hypothetical protein L3Y34_014039 [Caenorhabditis briggsae]
MDILLIAKHSQSRKELGITFNEDIQEGTLFDNEKKFGIKTPKRQRRASLSSKSLNPGKNLAVLSSSIMMYSASSVPKKARKRMVLQKQILDEKTPQQLIKLSQKSPNDASIVRRYARGKNTHIKLKISKDVEMTVHLGEWKLTLQMNKKPVFSIEDDGDSRKTKNQAKKFLKPNLENWEFSSPDQNSSTATARVSFASQLETIATFHLELLARTFGVKTIDFECNLDYLETDNTNHQMASNLSMFIITKLGVRYRKFVWPSFPIFYKVLKHLVKNNTEFHVTVAKLNGVQLGKLIATWQRSGSAKEIRLEGIRGTIGDVLKCIDVAEYQNGIVEIERFDGVKAILKLDGGKFSLQVHT